MRTKLIFTTLVAVLLLLPLQAVEWVVPLEVINGTGNSDLLSFGIHPLATDGLDVELGETNLPPLPPLAIFEARFLIDGYEGFELDLRNSNQEEINYYIFWQAGEGGYPVTVNWEADELPPGEFYISDIFDGYFTGIIDMNETGQIIVDASQSFITQLQIKIYPQQEGDIPPELDLPQYLRLYSSQRVPWLHLEDYVSDYDNLFTELSWEIEAELFISCEIDDDILRISYPENWTGSSAIQLTVNDPNGNSDSSEILLEVQAETVFIWEIDLHIAENELLDETLTFGINENATSGIDPELQEINLPPIPPAGQFDTRFIFPDGDSSRRDIRLSSAEQRIHHIYIQPVNPSSNCLMSWDEDLPPGEFLLQDGTGGFFFADQDMSLTDNLLIPAGINDIYITATPVIDTEAPTVPQNLIFSDYNEEYLTLNWEPAIDDNFHYYEIFLDSIYFENAGQFIFDFNNAENLTSLSTEYFEFAVWENVQNYYCRIRAWDIFGNVSPVSAICCLPLSAFYGDVDTSGIIDAFDAALVLRYSVGIDPGSVAPLPWEAGRIIRADVDGNEVIEAYDAALILQFVCEIIEVFPCQNFVRNK